MYFEYSEESNVCQKVFTKQTYEGDVLKFSIQPDYDDFSPQDFDELMFLVRKFYRWVKTNEVVVNIEFDFSKCKQLPVAHMQTFMDFLEKKMHITAKYILSTTFVLKPGVLETIVRGVLFMFPPQIPVHVRCVS